MSDPAPGGEPGKPPEDLAEFAAEQAAPPPKKPAAAASAGPPAAAAKALEDEPAPTPVVDVEPARRSPYDHLLKIRGDVGPTTAIALFLGGLSGLLLVWFVLTMGTPDPRQHTVKVGPDGRVAVPDRFDPEEAGFEVADHELEPPGNAPPGKERYRLVRADDGGLVLELPPDEAGQDVTFGYDLGSQPIVTPFILPKPGKVLSAVIGLTTGDAYQVQCPYRDCKSRPGYISVGSGDGAAIEAYAVERKGAADPKAVEAPAIACPVCARPLTGPEFPEPIVIPLAAHEFRRGLGASLFRTVVGFLVAAAICVPLGVLAGAFPPIKRIVSPIELGGGYTPPVALLPMATVVATILSDPEGIGLSPATANDCARIGFLVLITSFVLYPLVVKEVEAVDEIYINTAYMLGASRGQVVLQVLWPVAKANVWEHLRVCYAIGWACILLAEFAVAKVAGEQGLGMFMTVMERRHQMENYLASVLAILATGIAVDWLFRVVGKLLFPYREGR